MAKDMKYMHVGVGLAIGVAATMLASYALVIAPASNKAAQVAATASQDLFIAGETLQAAVETIEADKVTYIENLDTIAQARADLRDAERKVSDLESSLLCADADEFLGLYSSNSSISGSIKRWLEDAAGHIDRVDWERIWTNDDTNLHYLFGEYKWAYIAYFDDNEDTTNAVFSIDGGCWLDLPD